MHSTKREREREREGEKEREGFVVKGVVGGGWWVATGRR